MKVLLITGCTDNLRWYSALIGKKVPLLSTKENLVEYKSLEPAGYTNFVLNKDCVIVDCFDRDVKFY